MSRWPGATQLFDRNELPLGQPWSPHTYGEAQQRTGLLIPHCIRLIRKAGFGRTGALNPRLQEKKQNCAKSVFQFLLLCLFLISSFSPESWGRIRISKRLFPAALGPLPDSRPSCRVYCCWPLGWTHSLWLWRGWYSLRSFFLLLAGFQDTVLVPGRLRGSLTPRRSRGAFLHPPLVNVLKGQERFLWACFPLVFFVTSIIKYYYFKISIRNVN